MRCRTVVLGVMGLLGCAAQALADPIDISGWKRGSNATSHGMKLKELPSLELHFETAADIATWDANASNGESELTGSAFHFPSSTAQTTTLPNWSQAGADSAATPQSKHDPDKFKPKKPKDKCESSPCPTTVPEPATAMLLVIGMGLAGVASRYRLRL
jgi:PEP-CTERM motif-containing protein